LLSSEPPEQRAAKILKIRGVAVLPGKKRPRTTLCVNARGIARSAYWPNRSGSDYSKRESTERSHQNERSV